jgi:hypothetical protein
MDNHPPAPEAGKARCFVLPVKPRLFIIQNIAKYPTPDYLTIA